MSVYGCPEQYVNNWKKNHINITYSTDYILQEATIGNVSRKDDLIVVGPFGSFTQQTNFCIKSRAGNGSPPTNQETTGWDKDITETAEWPRGDYAIFQMKGMCPDGKFLCFKGIKI